MQALIIHLIVYLFLVGRTAWRDHDGLDKDRNPVYVTKSHTRKINFDITIHRRRKCQLELEKINVDILNCLNCSGLRKTAVSAVAQNAYNTLRNTLFFLSFGHL